MHPAHGAIRTKHFSPPIAGVTSIRMTRNATPRRATTLLLALLAAAACGDDGGASTTDTTTAGTTGPAATDPGTTTDLPTTGEPGTTADPGTTTDPGTGTTTPDPTTGGSDTSTGAPVNEPQIVHEFDVAMFQLPEGLDVRDGTAYVGLVTGPVFTVDPDDGTATIIGGLMGLPQDNTAIMTGLVAGKQGELYVALDVFAPGDFVTGIYKIPKGGGPGTLFASDPGMLFPNGFAHDANGDLLVTDSFAGAVHRVAIADGKVSTWVSDPALLGPNPDTCKTDAQFHLGANGIVVDGDRVLVTNSDQASIIEIPVDGQGNAGAPALFLGPDCDGLSGADGLVIEPGTGDILVPVNYKQRIIRIDASKTVTVLAEGGLLQSPATLASHPDGKSVLIANAAFEAATSDPASAHPALLSLALD